MCGRYTYFPGEFSDLRLTWKVDQIPLLAPRYNIAPSQEAPVILQTDGERRIELFQWGLIPSWAKDPAIGNKMINARAETLAEKPSFKRLLGKRRGIFPACCAPAGWMGARMAEGDHDEDSPEFLSHGFPSMPDAFRQLLSTIHMKPNY
jgi:putative SOS response-associated peptidase YedK